MKKHAFERALRSTIPLHVAAGYFHRVKTAGWTDPPDETGMLEGQFSAPLPQVVHKLTEVVAAKFRLMLAYHVYGESMRGLAQHAIGEQFREHADQERRAAEAYLKRAAVLGGGPVHLPEIEPPPASADPVGILMLMARAEQEGIAAQNELRALVGDMNPLSFQIEQYMVEDQHHLDELWQLLPKDQQLAAAPPMEGEGLPMDPAAMEGGEEPAADPAAEAGAVEPPVDGAPQEGGAAPSENRPTPKPKKEEPKPADEKTSASRFLAGLKKLGYNGLAEPGLQDPSAAPTPDTLPAAVPQASMEAPGPQPTAAQPPGARSFEPMNYVEAERAARAAQEINEASFYREKAQTAEMNAQSMGQQVQQIQSQLDSLSAQAAESGNQIMQAHQMASDANDQMVNQAALAARMRMGMQQLRAQMMEIASQDPEQLAAAAGGPTPMDVGDQMMSGPPGAEPGGVDGANGASQGVSEPGAQPGTPGASPSAGTPPGSAPGGAGATTPPESAPEEANSSSGEDSKKPDSSAETTVSIKKGAAETLMQSAMQRLPYALAGAGLGAAGGVLHGRKVESLREKVDALKGQQDGGFGKALELAQTQGSLAGAERARKSPLKAALVGGLTGAGLGAGVGAAVPAIQSQGKRLLSNISQLRQS